MKNLPRLPLPPLTLLLIASLATGPVQAEKGDRLKPLVVTSDRPGQADLANHRTELNGDVILTQGTMVLRAERVDVRETPDGYYQAYANGTAAKQVSFRQSRDTPGEFIEGSADQLEYDTRADTVRFVGKAQVRRLRGTQVTDEVTGAAIIYDKRTEVFAVEGGNASPNTGGRSRLVLMPRAASAPEAAEPAASGVPLKPSLVLQPRKPS
ncbi:lipopolysaccharide transport periplasmic protein LptA [Pelomonas sp. KK5]|uniref:lipopolysaccharide transport periplasmic protein LptA n=1 Tax=Pelomonas sp. KK5 TaxID=1855730 RepID=UPI00097BCA3F|nr:lipopolysaccharide transport periplasmic protein LptA [Pelomonas sp. KK5]